MGWASALAGAVGGSAASGLLGMKESRTNRRFQKYMSSTAMVRRVADLKNAGLNPILATHGSGAAMGQGSTASIPDVGGTINSAVQAKTARRAQQVAERVAKVTMQRTKAEAANERINAKLAQEMWNYYKNNKAVQGMVNAGMLGKLAGVPVGIAPAAGGVGQLVGEAFGRASASAKDGSWKLPEIRKAVWEALKRFSNLPNRVNSVGRKSEIPKEKLKKGQGSYKKNPDGTRDYIYRVR